MVSLFLTTTPRLVFAQSIDQLFQQGNAAQDARNYSQAEAIWRRVIQLAPKDPIAYRNLGVALREQGKLDEAIAVLRKAIQLDLNDADAYNNLGGVLWQQGKLDEATLLFVKL